MHPKIYEQAAILALAETTLTSCARITDANPTLTLDDAYGVQHVNLARKIEAGARLTGRKVGLTSRAVQEWLKVDQPDFGGLLDVMEVADGGAVSRASLLQPRVEGEVAFVLARDLDKPGVTNFDVISATDYVLPSIEIVDSRVHDWKITLVDTVADNASSGRYVLGTRPVRLHDVDLPLAGCVLRKNGRVVSTGAGAACLGNPVTAVAWLANRLFSLGTPLRAGEVVLSGALCPVAPADAGDFIEVEIAHVGRVSVRFT